MKYCLTLFPTGLLRDLKPWGGLFGELLLFRPGAFFGKICTSSVPDLPAGLITCIVLLHQDKFFVLHKIVSLFDDFSVKWQVILYKLALQVLVLSKLCIAITTVTN